MTILGISCYYHDAAAVLLLNGKVIAAAEEERFSRKKHDSSFPKLAIDYCLKAGQIKTQELDYAVFYEKPFRKFHRIIISSLSTYPKSYASFREAMRVWLTQKLWIKQEIASYLAIDPSKILFSEHHLSHAAGCFFPSPFKKAAILTVDGVGEWTTASFGVGEDKKIKILQELHFPESLGLLYSAFTAFLGFEVNEGEWKVMGLAPYGKPKFVDKIWKMVRPLADGSFSLDFSYFSFHYCEKSSFSSKFIDLFGQPIPPKQSHIVTQFSADIAASIQSVTEELLINMAKAVRKKTGMSNLCLSGGVALNSVANYKILQESGFKNIFIQPAPGDSGGAMGAALYLYHHVLGNNNRNTLTNVYLGQQYDNLPAACLPARQGKAGETIEQFLIKERVKYHQYSDEKLIQYVVNQIMKGKVIGWMQGRFEWGPRALGNRSILADPRNPRMKEIINSKVKFREAFRPFAPSVLAEHADKVFELVSSQQTNQRPTTKDQRQTSCYPFRFMLYVVPVRKEWQKKIPAVNHVDNTARPQLVFGDENPLYHRLLSSFFKKTGVPLLLNTSFNLKGEPIVNSPFDAYSTFIRSGIDILAMGNYVCEK